MQYAPRGHEKIHMRANDACPCVPSFLPRPAEAEIYLSIYLALPLIRQNMMENERLLTFTDDATDRPTDRVFCLPPLPPNES